MRLLFSFRAERGANAFEFWQPSVSMGTRWVASIPFCRSSLELISLQCENFSHKLALQQVRFGTFRSQRFRFVPKRKLFWGHPLSSSRCQTEISIIPTFVLSCDFSRFQEWREKKNAFNPSQWVCWRWRWTELLNREATDRPTFSLMSLSVTRRRRRRRRFQVGFHSAGTVWSWICVYWRSNELKAFVLV